MKLPITIYLGLRRRAQHHAAFGARDCDPQRPRQSKNFRIETVTTWEIQTLQRLTEPLNLYLDLFG